MANEHGISVKQLLNTYYSDELSEWMVMDRDYHILKNNWYQTGAICQTVANACAPRANNKPYEVEDFMPKMRSRPQSAEEMKAILDRACQMPNVALPEGAILIT